MNMGWECLSAPPILDCHYKIFILSISYPVFYKATPRILAPIVLTFSVFIDTSQLLS